MAAAEPYIARRPQLTLDTTVTLDCHAREVRLTPDDAEINTAVFCSPSRRVVGKTDWTLELVVLQSFGNGTTTEGLYDQLAPMSKTQVNYLLETDKLGRNHLGEVRVHPDLRRGGRSGQGCCLIQ